MNSNNRAIRNAQIKRIASAWRNAGATHIKIELEANSGLSFDDDDYAECWHCDGTGGYPCRRDEHEGSSDPDVVYCGLCGGTDDRLWLDCDHCDGTGREYYESNNLDYDIKQAFPFIVYALAYNDGSVDTELTLTIPIYSAVRLPEIIEWFTDYLGNYNTDNAGMHISALWGGRYPQYDFRHDTAKLGNFKSQVQMLLPAMYLLASGGQYTRGLGFREPKISTDKCSAVRVVANALEFRIFDPCYNNPDKVLDHLEVMANALEYYSKPWLKVNDSRFPEVCRIGNSGTVKALVNGSLSAVRATNAGLGYLKPKHLKRSEIFARHDLFKSIKEARGKTPLDSDDSYNRFRSYRTTLKPTT